MQFDSSYYHSDGLYLISGPCSVETEEQVYQTVQDLAKIPNLSLVRGGIWKPRTRPNSFEGVGEVGLKWLKSSADAVQLPCATEVANAKHVDMALKANVDVLWIGARTTVNPFSVQEIADALKGVDIPVMVKNPINPDLQLWIGAIERIFQSGIKKIAAIHRGFSPFEKTLYRNVPKWEIPIELMRLFPDLPVICDPSHIAGNPDLISYVSHKAVELNMSGLMIESHQNPPEAWSDAKQQITPNHLNKLLNTIKVKSQEVDHPEFNQKLAGLRRDIDDLDEQILGYMARRMNLAKSIGQYKQENNVAIFQLERWNQILKNRMDIGVKLSLSDEFLKSYLEAIHKESIRIQMEFVNDAM